MTTASEMRAPRPVLVAVVAIALLAGSGCGGPASSKEPAQLHLFGHVYNRGTIQLPSLGEASDRFGNLPVVSTSGSMERGSGTPLPTAVLLHTSSGYRNYDLSGAP
jgi:hypothetical protein